MSVQRETPGPTPNGGVRSVAYFQDEEGASVDESIASAVEILEFNAAGQVVGRTYGTFGEEVDDSDSEEAIRLQAEILAEFVPEDEVDALFAEE